MADGNGMKKEKKGRKRKEESDGCEGEEIIACGQPW